MQSHWLPVKLLLFQPLVVCLSGAQPVTASHTAEARIAPLPPNLLLCEPRGALGCWWDPSRPPLLSPLWEELARGGAEGWCLGPQLHGCLWLMAELVLLTLPSCLPGQEDTLGWALWESQGCCPGLLGGGERPGLCEDPGCLGHLSSSVIPAPPEAQLALWHSARQGTWRGAVSPTEERPRHVFLSPQAEGMVPKCMDLSRHQLSRAPGEAVKLGYLTGGCLMGPYAPCPPCIGTATVSNRCTQGDSRSPEPALGGGVGHESVPVCLQGGGCHEQVVGCRGGGRQPSAPRSHCASLYLPRSPSSLPFPSAAFYAARPRLQGLGIFPGFPSWGLAALILGSSQFCFLAARLRKSACAGRRARPFPTAAGVLFVSLPCKLPPVPAAPRRQWTSISPFLKLLLLQGCRVGMHVEPGPLQTFCCPMVILSKP